VTDPTSGATAAAAALIEALAGRSLTLATAESLTGGGLGAVITSVPGASAVYRGGVVAYATDLKQSLLGVSDDVVAEHGVVSSTCAEAMARGVRRLTGADLAISTTGVAGPDPQEGRPVGRVFIGLAGAAGSTAVRLDLTGDRAGIREGTCVAAVEAAREHWAEVVGWTNT
jgi:nicotinamide-nucleotide amidase